MLRDNNCGVSGNDPSSFLSAFLDDETSETSEIDVISSCEGIFYRVHESLNCSLNFNFLDPGLFRNLVNDVGLGHNLLNFS